MFVNKKILFICPIFHEYHQAIIRELEEKQAEVIFYPERNYGWIFKLINNFFPQYLVAYQNNHYAKALRLFSEKKIDYLFVIRGFMLPASFVSLAKEINPGIKAIMYQWDSNRSNEYFHLIEAFDKVYSFDFQDCRNNTKLEYLPLFYTNDVKEKQKQLNRSKYDFFFMGWYLPERYEALIKFKALVHHKKLTIKTFLYMPYSSYLKEISKGVKIDRSLISFKPMRRSVYLAILHHTKVVVDVSSSMQTGLSMRVIEALACNKKVLTNNINFVTDTKHLTKQMKLFDEKNPFFSDDILVKNDIENNGTLLSLGNWLNNVFTL